MGDPRLRLADDETMAIEWLHAPRRLLPDLRREDLASHSFYELLRQRRGIVIAGRPDDRADRDQPGGGGAARRAGARPAFLFERTTESEGGEVVEFVRSVYRGDRYRLGSSFVRRGDEHGAGRRANRRPAVLNERQRRPL